MTEYATALGLTIGIECLLVWLLARPRWSGRLVILAVLLNLLSHPLGTMLVQDAGFSWLAVEIAVVLLEALGYRSLGDQSWPGALALSFAANLVTALLSFVI